jgi:fatty acid desaturase
MVAIQPAWWTVMLAIPIIGTRYYALFIIGHDALHRRLFPSVTHNDRFADLVVFGPIGAITRINNRNHIRHHRLLATPDDPDRHKHGCFNKTNAIELIGFLTGVSSLLRSVHNVFAKTGSSVEQGQTSRTQYTGVDLCILVGWQVALIGGLTAFIGFWAWPVLWLGPVYIFAFLGDNVRSFLEHSHPEPDAIADRHRLITFTSNIIERQLFAPMNMNFHAAHHLWPSIPYYNLPRADREMRDLPASRDIEQRGSYFAYLWLYFRALPLVRCRDSKVEAA